MKEKIHLKYGDTKCSFTYDMENIKSIITANNINENKSFTKIVKEAIANPISSKKLSNLVEERDEVTVVISDITRSWQKINEFLPLIISEIKKGGVRLGDITVLAATGSHRSHSQKEIIQLLGKDLYGKVKFLDHNCHNNDRHIYLGKTSYGTPVSINEKAVKADKLILTGGITYHDLAGWSGGRKSILPGIASYETIMANHSLSLSEQKGEGIKDTVKSGNLENNPVHLDMEEGAEMLKADFIFNVIPDAKGGIATAVAGDYKKAHRKGCEIVSELFGINIEDKADLVIASCGGFPKDINLYQASKGLINAVSALKKGGYLILLAECQDGIGHPEVTEIINEYANNELREEFLRSNFTISKYSGYLITKAIEDLNLILVSNLNKKLLKNTDIKIVENIDVALNIVKDKFKKLPEAYIMADAANTLPIKEEDM